MTKLQDHIISVLLEVHAALEETARTGTEIKFDLHLNSTGAYAVHSFSP